MQIKTTMRYYLTPVRMAIIKKSQFSSVSQSCPTPCNPMDHSTPGFPITNSRSLLKLMYIKSVRPSTISSSVIPFSSCLQSFPASGSFPRTQFFASGGQSIGVSASASVLPMKFPLEIRLVGSPCSPRDSQESSPTPQFKSTNSSALSFLCGPTLTSIHDYWKNLSFE